MRPLEDMRVMPGRGVDSLSGTMCEEPRAGATWMPALVHAGDTLRARDGFELRVLFYAADADPILVHTYAYAAESNWTRYCPDCSQTTWSQAAYICPSDGFVRVCVRRNSGTGLPAAWSLESCVDIHRTPVSALEEPAWMTAEAERVTQRVCDLRQEDDLTLLLVSDPHWAVGCTWDSTVQSLRAVAQRVAPDALVQLGDLTDGLAPAEVTREVVGDMLDDLASVGVPVYGCLGNHDANYFKGNTDSLDRAERSELYLARKLPWYHVDFAAHHIRALFLDSFEPTRRERYGFCRRELLWVARELATTPQGWSVVVFAHVPLLASMHVWSKSIRLGPQLERLLRGFERRRGKGSVLAYIHGHNHADQISYEPGFPVVSVGCAKFEDFPEHKPWGSVTPLRAWGDKSQELWDVVLLNASGDLRFVRYGAGEERRVSHA